MEVIPLGPGFAAELRGVTLADIAADDAAYAAARAAFEEHSVLVFREPEGDRRQSARILAPLRPAGSDQSRLARHRHSFHYSDHHRRQTAKSCRPITASCCATRPTSSGTQIHPLSRVPALTSILSARIIPAHGGETEFVSTRLAFERLDADTAQEAGKFLCLARLQPFAQPDRARASPAQRSARRCRRCAGAWCGKIRSTAAARIYLASHAYAVEGMEQAPGNALIEQLMEAATAPEVSYVHQWQSGDVVMWDNRATMHRGRPWPAHEARLMVRTTISATAADGLESMRPPSRQAAE